MSFKTFTLNLADFMMENNGRIKSEMTVIPMHGESVESIREGWEGALDNLEIWKPHGWAGAVPYRKIKRVKKTCGRPFTGPVQINADGIMMVCCFDFDAMMTVGNTYQKTIKDILGDKNFTFIRKRHRMGVVDGLPCEHCDQLNEYEESPLLFSTKDETRGINKTSTNKFELKEI